MPQSFRFRQFEIHQNRCAMKVGTDAILLGAWSQSQSPGRILDIGTGTGVIALMLAQRFSAACVDGVEIDAEASEQARENVARSPWPDRINIICSAIADLPFGQTYDLIVSNPPWFDDGMSTHSPARDVARHSVKLTHRQLIDQASRRLSTAGDFCVILPAVQAKPFMQLAEQAALCCSQICYVKPTANADTKRVLMRYTKTTSLLNDPSTKRNRLTEELVVELSQRHHYSAEFQELTKEFYLRFR